MQALRVVYGDEVYIPLVLHALCAGFPSPADDYLEGEIDLNCHLIANRPEFVARIRRLASGEGGRRWTNPSDDPGSPMPFKANADRRHHIPKQRRRVTNWAEYDAALRQRGSLTVWFTEAAIAAWEAEPRTTPGGQPQYSSLAITTALTLKAVFRLALRQTEGLIGSIIRLLDLDLSVPDHTTLSRWAETLEVPRPRLDSDAEPVHLLVDSTGLKLCGPGCG